jgi:hypothetical protein
MHPGAETPYPTGFTHLREQQMIKKYAVALGIFYGEI